MSIPRQRLGSHDDLPDGGVDVELLHFTDAGLHAANLLLSSPATQEWVARVGEAEFTAANALCIRVDLIAADTLSRGERVLLDLFRQFSSRRAPFDLARLWLLDDLTRERAVSAVRVFARGGVR